MVFFLRGKRLSPLWGLVLSFDQQIFIEGLSYSLEIEKKQADLSPAQRGELGTNGLRGQLQATRKSQAMQAPLKGAE